MQYAKNILTCNQGVKYSIKFFAVFFCVFLLACNREGKTIYQPDPDDIQVDTMPMVIVVYDYYGIGDLSYNDLIYQGIEEVAMKNNLRTMQLFPHDIDEGEALISRAIDEMNASTDNVRRLLIVTSAIYDKLLREKSDLLTNPNADILYFETRNPLESKVSTFFINYYGAMYLAGYISPVFAKNVLVVAANPVNPSVKKAVKAFEDGFEASKFPKENIKTVYLGSKIDEGFSMTDSAAVVFLNENRQKDSQLIMPICGGSANVLARVASQTSHYNLVGIDRESPSDICSFSVVKHIENVVAQSIETWYKTGSMPKHIELGLADGFTGVSFHPSDSYIKSVVEENLDNETMSLIEKTAIEKEVGDEE